MPASVATEPLRSRLARRRLLVVTGKGGVGKSAVAATLGRLLAGAPAAGPMERGTGQPLRVLVFEVDPRENLHQMLGLPPSGGEIADAGGGLHLQNLKPRQVLDRVVAERIPLEAIRRRVLASPVYQQFAEGAPGLKEVAILGHALRLVRGLDPEAFGQKFDLVILDAPATGHGVSLLAAPRLLSEVIRRGPFGEMGAELAEFVADDEQSGIVVVTTPEEMPVHEALELRRGLAERLGRDPELLVVNAVYPPFPRGEKAPRDPQDDPLVSLWHDRRRLQEREMERLERDWPGPSVHLPKLPVDRGPELVATLTRCLQRELAAC